MKRFSAKLVYSVTAIDFAGVLVLWVKYEFLGFPLRVIESVDKMAEFMG